MINVGIVGYGNLGRGVLLALSKNKDFSLKGIFTRRNVEDVHPAISCPVYSVKDLEKFKGKVDLLILCGGSATDLPETTPNILKDFNTVDSFDTHARISEYFNKLDKIGKENNTLGLISVGWDPGLFSIMRAYFSSVLPCGSDYTFWGKGVSQGHSDAIRRIKGVKRAVQYTIPNPKAMESVRRGENPTLSTREKHFRECFVVAYPNEDTTAIENEIKTMPNYFADYDTTVHFITEEEFNKCHTSLPHGGSVIRNGKTTDNVNSTLEFSLKLDSNPEFTGSVLVAFARASYLLYKEGKRGAITVLDIAPKYLSPCTYDYLLSHTV